MDEINICIYTTQMRMQLMYSIVVTAVLVFMEKWMKKYCILWSIVKYFCYKMEISYY